MSQYEKEYGFCLNFELFLLPFKALCQVFILMYAREEIIKKQDYSQIADYEDHDLDEQDLVSVSINDDELTTIVHGNSSTNYTSFTPLSHSNAPDLTQSSLSELYDYFIKEHSGNPIPFNMASKLGLFLEVLGGTGGIYAWPPSWAYAQSKNLAPWLAYSFAISNPLSNVLFLMNATDGLFDYVQAELQPPKEIKDLIELPTTKQLASKYTKMVLGSVVCAIPFGIAVYLFPLPDCTQAPCIDITVAHSIITNTILHAVSWNLILSDEYWYFRLPIIPFEKLFSSLANCRNTSAQNEFLKLSKEQELIFSKYRATIASTFAARAQELVQDHIMKKGSSSQGLRAIQNNDMNLIKFVELARTNNPVLPKTQSPSFFRTLLTKANNVLTSGPVGFLGASVLVTGCIGWIANSYYIGAMAGLDITANIFAGTLPAYSTGVLCAFYGTFIGKQIYDYLTTWNGIRDKFSLEAQLYPKTFALFLLANLYISTFAYASGYELINTVFSDPIWDGIRPALLDISIPTLQVLSFLPLTSLFNVVIKKAVAKFGSLENDDTLAARLLLKMDAIKFYLHHMKGDALINDLANLSPEQQELLGVDSTEFEEDYGNLERLTTEIQALDLPMPDKSGRTSCLGFFSKKPKPDTEETSLLNNNTMSFA
ncbi:Uncharacterised protein [Legionella quateirensis]|uniref:Uncharacterized protein n=2 Tax=Legionella quateirensis TaxID=45072 RepID=A0A378KZT0_9GAMM|nr:hypothetical protein Lqua_3016 [Legionella quateirensis]STY17350.1 Uncharacterised protein [Legionella quateirensis]